MADGTGLIAISVKIRGMQLTHGSSRPGTGHCGARRAGRAAVTLTAVAPLLTPARALASLTDNATLTTIRHHQHTIPAKLGR